MPHFRMAGSSDKFITLNHTYSNTNLPLCNRQAFQYFPHDYYVHILLRMRTICILLQSKLEHRLSSSTLYNIPFAQFGFGVVVIYPYVLDLGSTSIGPKEPIPMAARFLNLAKKSAVFLKNVSFGVVVGN